MNAMTLHAETTSGELGRPFRAPRFAPCIPRALPFATIGRACGAPILWLRLPRALPWAAIDRAVGASNHEARCVARFCHSSAPTVQTIVAQGNALGIGLPIHFGAL